MVVDLRRLAQDLVKLRFSSVLEIARILQKPVQAEKQSLERDLSKATGEYRNFLEDEASSLQEMDGEVKALILVKSYATLESLLGLFVKRLSGRSLPKGKNKWEKAEEILSSAGIKYASLAGQNEVETIRLLVNCYKHNGGIIDKQELATRLKQFLAEAVDWERIDEKVLIDACETLAKDLASHL